jgi:hypothetical protein
LHSVKASAYPWLASFLLARDRRAIDVVALLGEDQYETLFGDGRSDYLRNVFLSEAEAQRCIEAHNEDWRKTGAEGQRSWRGFHLRPMTIALQGDQIVFPGFEKSFADGFCVEDVARLFVRRHGVGCLPSKELSWYVAWDAQWLVSFGMFDNFFCYSEAAVTEVLESDPRAAQISRVAAIRGGKSGPFIGRADWLAGAR